jgi:two-component system, NarL family, response regulator NreC
VPKGASDRELLAAIRVVAGGAGYVEPELGARLVVAGGAQAPDPLSERERDIVHLLALGDTNQEIGSKLYTTAYARRR